MEGRQVGLTRTQVQALLAGIALFLATLIPAIVMAVRRRGARIPPRRFVEPGEDIPTAAVLLHRQAPGWERAFPATLFDLADRGVIALERVDHGKGLFRTRKILLRRQPEAQEPLSDFESDLLREIDAHPYLNDFASKGRRFRSDTMKAVRDKMVLDGYLEHLGPAAHRALLLGGGFLIVALVCAILGSMAQSWALAAAGAAAGVGIGGLLVGSVRFARTRKGAESIAVLEGYLEQLREDLKQQVKMAPIQAAEFLFRNLPWLTLDPMYRGTEAAKLRRRLKKEHGELRPVPWAIDRTRDFQKATENMSSAYAAFYPFLYVSQGTGGAVAPTAGGGAVGGAGGGGAAGGGGGGAG